MTDERLMAKVAELEKRISYHKERGDVERVALLEASLEGFWERLGAMLAIDEAREGIMEPIKTGETYAALKELMRERHVTAVSVARAIGYHPTHFSRKVNSLTDWHTEDIRKIAKLLRLTPAEIVRAFELGGENE